MKVNETGELDVKTEDVEVARNVVKEKSIINQINEAAVEESEDETSYQVLWNFIEEVVQQSD